PRAIVYLLAGGKLGLAPAEPSFAAFDSKAAAARREPRPPNRSPFRTIDDSRKKETAAGPGGSELRRSPDERTLVGTIRLCYVPQSLRDWDVRDRVPVME